ncbi:MAG: SDR family NAD(P)-dependent oxidoreductase, partial [Proteobacteria bacterium]|nr:SDR family NAD(P)-dependent oxidoreductase [Pseudomonadota bacterium]
MGRCAIVVGARARQGIGGALCRRFAREGLHVAVVGRTLERLEELVEEVRAQGGQASSVVADATRAEDVERVFDETRRIAGTPELVVYNAGANDPRPLLEMDNSYFERMWRLGCFGGFLVGREAARRMLPGGGTLIFTG